MSKKKIILGLDIGTQFCYAGYLIKTGDAGDAVKFCPAFDADNMPLGIPSTIAVTQDGKLIVGQEADDEVKKGNAYKTREPIKSIIRGVTDFENRNFKSFTNGNYAFSKHELLKTLLKYIKNKINQKLRQDFNGDEFEIIGIRFACPNLKNADSNPTEIRELNEQDYKSKVKKVLVEVFSLKQEFIKVELESGVGGLLAAQFYNNDGSYSKIITIDIGAGTTDIAVVNSDSTVANSRSAEFGGLDMDALFLKGAYEYGNVDYSKNTAVEMCNYKKWLFNSGDYDEDNIDPKIKNIKEKILNQSTLLNDLSEEVIYGKVNISEHWRSFVIQLKYVKKWFIEGDENVLILLLGGTSRIPFIKNQIQNIFGVNNDIQHLTDNKAVSEKNINDASFIAVATLLIDYANQRIKPTKEPSDEIIFGPVGESIEVTVGAPDIVALKVKSGAYYIIADTTPSPSKKNYFVTEDVFYDVWSDNIEEIRKQHPEEEKYKSEYPVNFDPKLNLYKLETDKRLPRGTTKLEPQDADNGCYMCCGGDENSIITLTNTYPIHSYVGQKDELTQEDDGGRIIDRYYGTCYHYVYGKDIDEKLQITIYDDEAHQYKPHYGDIPDEDKHIYEEMKKLSGQDNLSKISIQLPPKLRQQQQDEAAATDDEGTSTSFTGYHDIFSKGLKAAFGIIALISLIICLGLGIPLYFMTSVITGAVIISVAGTLCLIFFVLYIVYLLKLNK